MMVSAKDIKDSNINCLAALIFNFVNKTVAKVMLDTSKYSDGLMNR